MKFIKIILSISLLTLIPRLSATYIYYGKTLAEIKEKDIALKNIMDQANKDIWAYKTYYFSIFKPSKDRLAAINQNIEELEKRNSFIEKMIAVANEKIANLKGQSAFMKGDDLHTMGANLILVPWAILFGISKNYEIKAIEQDLARMFFAHYELKNKIFALQQIINAYK